MNHEGDAAINGRSSTNAQSPDAQSSARATVEERPFRAAFDAPSSTLSSRAEQDDSLANHPAESRDLHFSGKQHRGSSKTTPDNEIFWKFVHAGHRLAEIHVQYEQQPEYPLTKTEKAGEKLDYRVEKMRLSKDKTTLTYNRFLTLTGIPKETYEYRLGNRSALEWIIDQYQVSTDKRSDITNDPNRTDDETYILRLIGQIITVSLETVKIVQSLPALGIAEDRNRDNF